jgi:hypothetical protein
MKVFMPRLIVIVALFLCMTACSTVNTLDTTREERPHRKKSSMFNYSYDDVFNAAKTACQELGLRVYQENRSKGQIYAKSLVRWFGLVFVGYGEKVAVYVLPVEEDYVQVEVVVQKVYLLSVGYVDWRDRILKAMDKLLEKKPLG